MIFKLRSPVDGEPLPEAQVKASAVECWLKFGNIPGTREKFAEHLDPKTRGSRDQLRTVHISQIDGGVLLAGWDIHGGRAPTRQTWWCVPGPMDDLTLQR